MTVRDSAFYRSIGSKGGKAKVPKGLAILKDTDPKKFKEILEKAKENKKAY